MFSDPKSIIVDFGLEAGNFVADFGAGSGHYTLASSKAVGGEGRVYAVDIQKELLERIKNVAKLEGAFNIEYVWGDLERIGGSKIREASVDAAIVANILFQVEHKDVFVSEILRVLKPQGKILIVEWADSFSGMGPGAGEVFTKEKAKALFEGKGLKFVRELEGGSHHYGLVFKK